MTCRRRKGPLLAVADDEEPNRVDLKRLRELKPVFQEDGVLTVGNSPSCNDGAAALVVMTEEEAENLGLRPMARIVGYAGAALAPEWFTIAPVEAIKLVLKKTGLSVATSTCLKSMRHFQPFLSRSTANWGSTQRESTSTAARSRWAIRSVLPVRGFLRPCSMRWKPVMPVEVSPASVSEAEKRWR